jgi:general stress protein 26
VKIVFIPLQPTKLHSGNLYAWHPQVAQFSSSAASNPQLYALKLSQERVQQMEELQQAEPMRWEDIV